MLEDFSKRLAALSALSLILSVAYDYTYVLALGLSFAELPTTLADHVRTAVIWAPGVAVGFLLGGIAGLGTPPLPASERSKLAAHKAVDRLFFFGAIPLLILVSFIGPPTQAVIAASSLIGMLLMRFQPGAKNIESRLGSGTAPIVFVVPVALALVALIGWFQGTALIAANPPVAEVTVKHVASDRVINATGLRRFSLISVVVEPTRVHVLPSESIASVQYRKPSHESLTCILFQQLCRSTK